MTIKEYTVTEEILTYKRAYDTINSEEIKMPYTVDEFSNLIDKIYNDLKFDLKIDNAYLKENVCIICDFYIPFYTNSKNEILKEIHSKLILELRGRNAEGFIHEDNEKFSIELNDFLRFGPYTTHKIEMNEIDYIQFKNLPLKFKTQLPESSYTSITDEDLKNDLAKVYIGGITDFGRFMLLGIEMKELNTGIWELNEDYRNYINKFNKIITNYAVKGDEEYGTLESEILKEVHYRIMQDSINKQFQCLEIYLKPFKKIRNFADDELLSYLKEGKVKELEELDFNAYLKKFEDNVHLYPISAFMTKELANALMKNFPKKCKNKKDSFSYFK